MIGIVTDSNAQMPRVLIERYGIEVVPLTVTIDGTPYLEGVDIDEDAFYARFESGTPEVSTSQPSPGLFAKAYEALAGRGADEILSVHIGSAVSGTVNAARIAAGDSPVPVRIVDTGTASFAVACCGWEAAEAIANGASVEDAAAVAEHVAQRVGNVFVVQALDLARAGGRLAQGTDVSADAIPILSLVGGAMERVGQATDVDKAARLMATAVTAGGNNLRVGVGVADAAAEPLGERLEQLLRDDDHVREIVRYRVAPSVAVHTGPGTAGAVYYASA